MAMSDRMKSIADMTASMSTRSPDKIIKDKSKPNLDVLTVISEKMKGVPSDLDPVQVAGEYEDMLM